MKSSRFSGTKSELLKQLLAEGGIELLQAPVISRSGREGHVPVSFAQQRLWFLEQLQPGNPFYVSSVAVEIKGRLNIPTLEQSLNEIIRRHESLRTTFAMVEGVPVQVIAPELFLELLPVRPEASSCRAKRSPGREIGRRASAPPF